MKRLYIIFDISLLINIMLGTYLIKIKPVCERSHIDVIEWSWEDVPNEIMAREIADAIELDRIGDEDKEVCDVTVGFDSQSNEWEVVYEFGESGGVFKKDIVCIRKDNGLITTYRRIWRENEES